jgi:hypothetical protein
MNIFVSLLLLFVFVQSDSLPLVLIIFNEETRQCSEFREGDERNTCSIPRSVGGELVRRILMLLTAMLIFTV